MQSQHECAQAIQCDTVWAAVFNEDEDFRTKLVMKFGGETCTLRLEKCCCDGYGTTDECDDVDRYEVTQRAEVHVRVV